MCVCAQAKLELAASKMIIYIHKQSNYAERAHAREKKNVNETPKSDTTHKF